MTSLPLGIIGFPYSLNLLKINRPLNPVIKRVIDENILLSMAVKGCQIFFHIQLTPLLLRRNSVLGTLFFTAGCGGSP